MLELLRISVFGSHSGSLPSWYLPRHSHFDSMSTSSFPGDRKEYRETLLLQKVWIVQRLPTTPEFNSRVGHHEAKRMSIYIQYAIAVGTLWIGARWLVTCFRTLSGSFHRTVYSHGRILPFWRNSFSVVGSLLVFVCRTTPVVPGCKVCVRSP